MLVNSHDRVNIVKNIATTVTYMNELFVRHIAILSNNGNIGGGNNGNGETDYFGWSNTF